MLKTLSNWFQAQLQQPTENPEKHTLELATAVLLYEIMRADEKFEESEQTEFESILSQHFSLTHDEKQVLLAASKEHAQLAVDFQQFTRIINDKCEVGEKLAILESLWRIAYADQHLDSHEIHLIRRISDLLHIPHSEFIRAKLKVTES